LVGIAPAPPVRTISVGWADKIVVTPDYQRLFLAYNSLAPESVEVIYWLFVMF